MNGRRKVSRSHSVCVQFDGRQHAAAPLAAAASAAYGTPTGAPGACTPGAAMGGARKMMLRLMLKLRAPRQRWGGRAGRGNYSLRSRVARRLRGHGVMRKLT